MDNSRLVGAAAALDAFLARAVEDLAARGYDRAETNRRIDAWIRQARDQRESAAE
jgi:hypothetical protein